MARHLILAQIKKVTCKICGETSKPTSKALGICGKCAREYPQKVRPFILKAHAEAKGQFGLPGEPPRNLSGVTCDICVNQCQMGEGELGFCGLRTNRNGRLIHLGGTSRKGIVQWYYDPLPTNCVADWVCPTGSGAGYPEYSCSRGPEYGYKNLAVFLGACSFDCLFCQNWHYREMSRTLSPVAPAEKLAQAVDEKTACICYFGGDSTPQLPFALAASKKALEINPGRILRICWESDGAMNPTYLKKMAKLSLESGGCIKFDLKAFDGNLHFALTEVTNRQTLENFQALAKYIPLKPTPPFLIASTLLVPGYINAEEVFKIAKFIADLDSTIPYSLLAFYPSFMMNDLPTTSLKQAEECRKAAQEAGLKRVKVGNIHLLS